jgi:hypothetical protein
MIDRIVAFFHWLGTPIRAFRALFPFTHEGRQTLIYLMCAFSAPILTLMTLYILDATERHQQWAIFADVARIVAYSLLIITCAFGMFVAFRSLSLGSKEGLLNLTSKDSPDTAVQAAKAVEKEVTEAAQIAVEKVEAKAENGTPDAGLPEGLR